MIERIHPKIKDHLINKFGRIPELTHPFFDNLSYQFVNFDESANHLELQEIREGSNSTAFIDYVMLNGQSPVKSRRERGFYIIPERDNKLKLYEGKVRFEEGDMQTEYRLDYQGEDHSATHMHLYKNLLTGRRRLHPLLAHVSFYNETPSSVALFPIDSPEEVFKYEESADKSDPNEKGSIIYESYNPNMVSFMNIPGGDLFIHTNLTGRTDYLAWDTQYHLKEFPIAFKALRENGKNRFQRINFEKNTIFEMILPEKINVQEMGDSIRSEVLEEWTSIPSKYPAELRTTKLR